MNYEKFLEEGRKRAVLILSMREEKVPFAAIGKHFGISSQRAQQIFKAAAKLTKGASK